MAPLESITTYVRLRLSQIGVVEYAPEDEDRNPLPVERITIDGSNVFAVAHEYPPLLRDEDARIIYQIGSHGEVQSYRESAIESMFLEVDCQAVSRQLADRIRDRAMSSLRAGRRARRFPSISDDLSRDPPAHRALFVVEILA